MCCTYIIRTAYGIYIFFVEISVIKQSCCIIDIHTSALHFCTYFVSFETGQVHIRLDKHVMSDLSQLLINCPRHQILPCGISLNKLTFAQKKYRILIFTQLHHSPIDDRHIHLLMCAQKTPKSTHSPRHCNPQILKPIRFLQD